jgi:histidine triad (HIT) family protein
MSRETDCVFCRIIDGSIPSSAVYEDGDFLAFKDIHPAAPTHILVVPKKHVSSLNELDDPELAGKLLMTVAKVARMLGVEKAYRTVFNTGKGAGQSVFHIHAHILAGRDMSEVL